MDEAAPEAEMLNLSRNTVMEDVLVPIFICTILPIAIVWLVGRVRKHETDKKTEIMLKAIENGAQIDTQLFKSKQSTRSIKQELMDKFTGACVTSFMGVAFLVIGLANQSNPGLFKGMWFIETALSAGAILMAIGFALFLSYLVSRRTLAKEIEAEDKNQEK
jgi:mannose/fructose/N-acetylgalactosamine-specific phosphotransferase system component IIC